MADETDQIEAGTFEASIAQWLVEQGCDVVFAAGGIYHAGYQTWRSSASKVGRKLALWSIKPHSSGGLPIGVTRAMYNAGKQTIVDHDKLRAAMPAFATEGTVTGIKLGSINGGNTKVIPLYLADDTPAASLGSLMHTWHEAAPTVRRIGRSPGQMYGEFALSLSTLGLAGFHFDQPIEIYPGLLYRDSQAYCEHTAKLLPDSRIESIPHIRHLKNVAFRAAPTFQQATFICLGTGHRAALDQVHENRRAWLMYPKPALAERIFDGARVRRLIELARHHTQLM